MLLKQLLFAAMETGFNSYLSNATLKSASCSPELMFSTHLEKAIVLLNILSNRMWAGILISLCRLFLGSSLTVAGAYRHSLTSHWAPFLCQPLSLPKTPGGRDSAWEGGHSLSEVSQTDKRAMMRCLRQSLENSILVLLLVSQSLLTQSLKWHCLFAAVPSFQDFRSRGGSWRGWWARRRVWPAEAEQQW